MTHPNEKIVITFAQWEAVRALLAACQLMIDGDWITACAAARAAIAQAEAAGISTTAAAD
jgi:hypothetical protein